MYKRLSVAAALAVSLLNVSPAMSNVDQKDGKALFVEHCAFCHGGGAKPSERLAPPVMGIRSHYLPTFTTKGEFSDAIVRWVKAPSTDYTLMPGAIKRFKLMPALDLEEVVIEKIAAFIYSGEFDAPGWYQKHYREEHGDEPAK